MDPHRAQGRLRHAVAERHIAIGEGPILQLADLPTEVASPGSAEAETFVSREPAPVASAVPGDGPEARRIRDALVRTSGNRDRAAKLLGLSRVTLWRRIRDLGIA